jgi:hypothetical protein
MRKGKCSMKVVYINVTYLDLLEFEDNVPDEVIDQKVEEWLKENHPDCSDRDWDINIQ